MSKKPYLRCIESLDLRVSFWKFMVDSGTELCDYNRKDLFKDLFKLDRMNLFSKHLPSIKVWFSFRSAPFVWRHRSTEHRLGFLKLGDFLEIANYRMKFSAEPESSFSSKWFRRNLFYSKVLSKDSQMEKPNLNRPAIRHEFFQFPRQRLALVCTWTS